MELLISNLCSHAAASFGDRIAIKDVQADVELSFREIERLVAAFAGGLKSLGLQHGDRVVLHLRNSWRWIVAYYAISRVGAVIVPANILLSAEEVAYMAHNSGASLLVACGKYSAAVIKALSGYPPTVNHIISEGGNVPSDLVDFETLLEFAPIAVETPNPDDLLTIAYTSGTTGRPKGAMLTQRNVFMSTCMTATVHARQGSDVVVSALPLSHVYGNVVMNAVFLVGMRLVLFDRFDAEATLRAIESHRATMFEGVPTMYYYMLSCPALDTCDLSSLRCCTVGGQTMPAAKISAVIEGFGCPLLELWGMTEVGGPAISHSPYWNSRPGTIGLPFPTMEARIVDLDDPDTAALLNIPGELQVRGSLVCAGYWRDESATKSAFTEDGWLFTGDVCTRTDDGYLSIVDRKKDMIITAGYKIYPAEIERVIADHPCVAMVAVAPIADELKGELAKAYIVLHPTHAVSEQAMLEFCKSHLASYKVPKAVQFVADLPKTSTGKILRRQLRAENRDSNELSENI